MPETPTSDAYFREALDLFPGGVNSPVRAFRAVGGAPLFLERGEGAHVFDVDGRRYIDYVLSYGPLVLGHAHPRVVEALQQAATRGTSYGAPTPAAIDLARLIREAFPSLELLRFVNSGTEATMSAIRLARGFTGRDKVVKCAGCYHGHADLLLVQAGSGVATLGLPDSPGVPRGAVQDTLVVPFNDADALDRLFAAFPDQIAAVILEPVAGNMGVVPPADGYLERVRALTEREDALLIFDEVMTGFRVHPGGAQARYGVRPDLTALGKVIGGGLPVGAYGGRREIMERIAPAGPVYQAGTLSGNPLAMAAGRATLEALGESGTWERLESAGETLETGLREAAGRAGVPVTLQRVGAMLGLFFHPGPVRSWNDAAASDTDAFARFFRAMLARGIYLPPSQFEAFFLSIRHDEAVIDRTLDAAADAFAEVASR